MNTSDIRSFRHSAPLQLPVSSFGATLEECWSEGKTATRRGETEGKESRETSPRPLLPRIILSAWMKIIQHLSLITSRPPIPQATERIDRRERYIPTWSERLNPAFYLYFIGIDGTEMTECGRERFGYSDDGVGELTRSVLT